MQADALLACVSTASCLVTQMSTAVIVGMLLFLVASGLSLIFGVLGIVNFAHGAFYMVGAYTAFTAYKLTDSFVLAILAGTLGTAVFGVLFERLVIARVYGRDLLLQLLACYATTLILDDLVKLIFGAEYQMMGMPAAFALPPIQIAGGFLPPYYLFMVGLAMLTGLLLWLGINKTLMGKVVRALAVNPRMVGVLGRNTTLIYAGVFGLGSGLAGLAGALAAPIRTLTPGIGLSFLIDSFIVTVIGGMGSIAGAFVAALLVGFVRAFGAIGFPLFVDGLMFAMMVIVLVVKPTGLLGREAA
ncbi:MAG: branched-chain amino acid ABC transporter permease [Deltaproteobacteria bacterium]|nr:MAG: branched-chain amino acid ABC transporter permease [Deltaproteobacteria bacterium]